MVRRRSAAGFSVLEATVALTVLALLAGTFLWGGASRIHATGAAFRASAAHRIATGVLEDALDEALAPGESAVDAPRESPLEGLDVRRIVTERESGLFEVTAVVRWTEPADAEPRTSRITSLVAREPVR